MNAVEHLHLLISNDAALYQQRLLPIQQNLAGHMARGDYDAAKAARLFRYLVDDAAKKYQSIVGRTSGRERNDVAELFERSFRAEWSYGHGRAPSISSLGTSIPTSTSRESSLEDVRSLRPKKVR